MRTIVYLFLFYSAFLFSVKASVAQEFKVPVANSKSMKLILKGFVDDLNVVGYDGNEIVFFKTPPKSNYNESAIKSTDKLGSNFGLSVEKVENQIEVTFYREKSLPAKYTIKVPNGLSLRILSNCNIVVTSMNNEIEISGGQFVKIANTTGSIVVSGKTNNIMLDNCSLDKNSTISVAVISGNIMARFIRIDTKEPVLINSISGNIMIEAPATIQANLKLKSTSGMIMSDFDIPEESKSSNEQLGDQINYQTNGGGTEIRISSVSGNIIVKKR